jgi:hypothetical protein
VIDGTAYTATLRVTNRAREPVEAVDYHVTNFNQLKPCVICPRVCEPLLASGCSTSHLPISESSDHLTRRGGPSLLLDQVPTYRFERDSILTIQLTASNPDSYLCIYSLFKKLDYPTLSIDEPLDSRCLRVEEVGDSDLIAQSGKPNTNLTNFWSIYGGIANSIAARHYFVDKERGLTYPAQVSRIDRRPWR